MLTIEEFIKLPDEEKGDAYKELSPHDMFLWRTQYSPIGFEVIGHEEISEEDRIKNKKRFREHLKKIGVIED
ncbi:hypothetical protein KGF41_00095 [Clostridioides sp. ZZV14-6150]|uniref:hypothetical protein n=1 Tax=Clostridioides sp. ZZV14-6150 TaxID=2811493 RepID=UPI001D1135E4|nr:hypothetical protein [Clostridioides sp. ZZV14-6150]